MPSTLTLRFAPPTTLTKITFGPIESFEGPIADRGALVIDGGLPARVRTRIIKAAAGWFAHPADVLTARGGEAVKSLDGVARLLRQFSLRDLDRGSVVVAVGGGAWLDAVGFAASVWLRGISWVAVPTTLLAQVDAGIGAKTALDFAGAKNQLGTFHAPAGVWIDASLARTVTSLEWRSGLGEVAKMALLAGGRLHALVLREAAGLRARSRVGLDSVVRGCVLAKSSLVAADPLEHGRRAILNAGHTIGHIVEAHATAEGKGLPHGEAVAIGLGIESILYPPRGRAAVRTLLDRLNLESVPGVVPDRRRARALLLRDKKRRGTHVTIPIIHAPGRVTLEPVPLERILSLLDR